MAIQIINTGTSANAGNGDSIRTAFTKVNQNFDFLNGAILGTSTNFNSGVRDVVKPMFLHDAHNGLVATYNALTDRIILTVDQGDSRFNNISVLQTATLYDVVMTGTVTVGFLQGFDDVNIIKYADDGSLNFRMKNTYGLGSSEINLLDYDFGSFNIVHQSSAAPAGIFSAGQNYIYDDAGRAINIGRSSDVNFHSNPNFVSYGVPSLSVKNTGTVEVNSTLTLSKDFFVVGNRKVEFSATTITIDGIQVGGFADRLVAGNYSTVLTTAGNLILPGDAVLAYGRRIPSAQTVTNYGAVFSSDGPFGGVGSIYFNGTSRLEIQGGSNFDLNTGTYTIEWFQKPATTGTDQTIFALGPIENSTLRGANQTLGTETTAIAILEGVFGEAAPYLGQYVNTWSHVAIVKTPSDFSVFINGVQTVNTASGSFPPTRTTTTNLTIGSSKLYTIHTDFFTGNISNMRWEARAVYTATFVPPSSRLTATSFTRLLLAADNSESYLWDTSGVNPDVPQTLSWVLDTSSLSLTDTGILYLDQNGAYDGQKVSGTTFRIDTDQPNYTQIYVKNHNSGTTATSDLMIFNNTNTLDSQYIDLGINSWSYSEPGYSLHAPGSGYLFTKDTDLVVGTEGINTRLIFHAGQTDVTSSAAIVDGYAWRFNRDVQIVVGTPGPLNFTVWNTLNNSAATAVYQALNDQNDFAQFGIMSTNPGAYDGNIAPRDGFLHIHTTATLHIGNQGHLAFYSDQNDGYYGTPTLFMSRFDRSSTFAGHVLPASDLTYDLGSSSTQWRSLYVGTSTIYIGGVPITVNRDTNTLVVGTTPGTTSTTATNLATESFVIDYVAQNGGGGGVANTGDITFTATTITAPIDSEIVIASKTVERDRARLRLDPTNGDAYLEVWSYENVRNDNSTGWSTGTWDLNIYGNPRIEFTGAVDLANFIVNTLQTLVDPDTVSYSINGGEYIQWDGGSSADPQTGYASISTNVPPPVNPTVITSVDWKYALKSRIGTSYGNARVEIDTANQDLDINIDGFVQLYSTGNIDINNSNNSNSSDINLYSGDDILLKGKDKTTSDSEGGDINIFAGRGGDADSGDDAGGGGDIQIRGGRGGDSSPTNNSGYGGNVSVTGGNGGDGSVANNKTAYPGGDITIDAGNSGWNDGNPEYGNAGGNLTLSAGDSNSSIDNGGFITIRPGTNVEGTGTAGYVKIEIPSSNGASGGNWIFTGEGNILTVPTNSEISTTAAGDITLNATDGNVIIKTGIGTYTFAYDAMSSIGYLEIPFSIQGPEQTGFTTPSGYGIGIDSANSPASVDIGNVGGGKFLRIEDGTNPADIDLKGFGKITLRTDGDTGPLWTYDTNGSLTIPNDIHGSGANAVVVQNTASGVAYLELPVDPSTDDVILANQDPGGVVTLRAGDFGLEKDWRFDANGQLNLPGGANIFAVNYSAAIRAGNDGTGTYGVVNIQTNNPNTTSTWSFGTQGEITLPGGGIIQENQITNELWGTTTTSLSLYPGGSSQVNQRLEIYSTGGGEGDHLHLTAGDQTSTDLFLGNDTQYFAVAASGYNVIRARPGEDSPTSGTSAGAGSSVTIYAGSAGDNGGDPADGASGGDIFAQAGISSAGYGGNVYLQSGAGQTGYGNILLSTDGGSNSWIFDRDDNLTFPSGGSITFDSSASSNIYGLTGIEFADATTQTTAFTGTAALLDITNTNGLGTTYYLTFVENRSNDQEVRADVDLTYQTADNILGVGKISINSTTASTSTTTGALTVAGGVGIQGDIYAGNIYSNGIQLTAGGGGGGGGVTSITAGTGTFVSTSTGNVVVWVGNTSNLEETFESKTTGTGVTVFDCTTNRLFYQTGLTGNITPNFTNLNLSTGEATSISIVVVQGGTARNISGIQVAGTTTGVTLLWQGAASAPSGNASRTDVFTFSIMNTASNSYTILGMLTSFGGV